MGTGSVSLLPYQLFLLKLATMETQWEEMAALEIAS